MSERFNKIAIIGKASYLYWDNHVVDAFTSLGLNVMHFQVNTRPMHIQVTRGLAKAFLGGKLGKNMTNRWHAGVLLEKLEAFRPDVIFYVSTMFIPMEYFEILGRLTFKPRVIGWDADGGPGYERNVKYVPYLDTLFESEQQYCDTNSLGFRKMVHLPFCANPEVHRNFFQQRENKIYFCGSWTAERDPIITALSDFPLVLKGWRWENLSKKGKKFEIVNGTVDIHQQVKDYNRYAMVINKHQSVNNHFAALNMRTFEAPACGALLLNDWRGGLSDYFTEGEEIAVYRSVEQLGELCESLLSDSKNTARMAGNGYERTIREHTYRQRMKTVIDTL